MEPPTITTSASNVSILTEALSMAKSASFASVHTVPSQPKKEEEELREEPQTVSAEDGVREEVEDKAAEPVVPTLSTSEHKTKSKEEEVSSPRVDESVEYTFDQHGDMETMLEEIQEEVSEVAAAAEAAAAAVEDMTVPVARSGSSAKSNKSSMVAAAVEDMTVPVARSGSSAKSNKSSKVAAAVEDMTVPAARSGSSVKSNKSKDAEVPVVDDDNVAAKDSAEEKAQEQSTEPDADKAKPSWIRSAFLCGIDKTTCCAAPDVTALDGVDMENASVPSAEQPSEPVEVACSEESIEQVFGAPPAQASVPAAAAAPTPNLKADKSWMEKLKKKRKKMKKKLSKKLSLKRKKSRQSKKSKSTKGTSSYKPPIALPVIAEETDSMEVEVEIKEDGISISPSVTKDASVMELSIKPSSSASVKSTGTTEKDGSVEELSIKPSSSASVKSTGTKEPSVEELSIKASSSAGKDDGKEEETVVEEAKPTEKTSFFPACFSCGVGTDAANNNVFEGLSVAPSDAAVGVTTDIEEESMETKEEGDMEKNEVTDMPSSGDKEEPRSRSSPTPVVPVPVEAIKASSSGDKEEPRSRRSSPVPVAPVPAEEKVSSSIDKENLRSRVPTIPLSPRSRRKSKVSTKSSSKVMAQIDNAAPAAEEEDPPQPSFKARSQSYASTKADDLPSDLESMSLDLATMSSTLTEDNSVVGQLEAKFDLYKQKYGLIQKFGSSLNQLKKQQAEVKAKESEIKEKELEIEKCTKVKKLKKKKKELAVLESELAGLKIEEEAIQRPVTRLHELLNAQLEQKRSPQLSSSGSEVTSNYSNGSAATKNLFQRIVACTGPAVEDGADGFTLSTAKSGATEATGYTETTGYTENDNDGATDTDGEEEEEEETVQESTMDRVLDVVCGIHH